MHEEFFRNLFQATGAEVIITVETFLQRLELLESGDGAYVQDGKAARAILAKRGIDDATVTEAKKMVSTLQKQGPTLPVANGAADAAALEANENALWNWYLEWSQVARTAMSNRALLKLMGLTGSKRRVAEEEEDEEEKPAPVPAPVA